MSTDIFKRLMMSLGGSVVFTTVYLVLTDPGDRWFIAGQLVGLLIAMSLIVLLYIVSSSDRKATRDARSICFADERELKHTELMASLQLDLEHRIGPTGKGAAGLGPDGG